jgi:hypothetical protein
MVLDVCGGGGGGVVCGNNMPRKLNFWCVLVSYITFFP